MIKAMIFDFDGVIVDTENKKIRDLRKVLGRYEYAMEIGLSLLGKKTEKYLSKKFPEVPKNLIEKIVKERREIQYEDFGQYKLIRGLRDLLEFLKSKKLAIAITTGSEREFVNKLLEVNSLTRYFDLIIAGEDFKSSKPNPECYAVTLSRIGLKPSEVLIIEDSLAGIEAAKKLEIKVFAVRTYLDEQELSIADKVFRNHVDVLDFLKNQSSRTFASRGFCPTQ
ncbi:MAG: HAD family phosphatase [archaeon]